MNQDTRLAPFNVGDHVRYVADEQLKLQTGPGNESELVLVPGMAGVVILSSGDLNLQGEAAYHPWHCRVQFSNGYQIDILPNNLSHFERAEGPAAHEQTFRERT